VNNKPTHKRGDKIDRICKLLHDGYEAPYRNKSRWEQLPEESKNAYRRAVNFMLGGMIADGWQPPVEKEEA